jgi:hypothetical protein
MVEPSAEGGSVDAAEVGAAESGLVVGTQGAVGTEGAVLDGS